MQTSINFVDATALQEILDQQFGQNIFTVVVDKTTNPKTYYLEYSDTVPQNLIDQAIVLSNQNSIELLNAIKVNLYNMLEGKVDKAILAKEKPRFNDSEIQQAYDWLQTMTNPVPTCVVFLSLDLNITNQMAAEKIANSKIDYDNFIVQVNNIKTTAQSQILSATNVFEAKNIATTASNEIKNLA